MLLPCCVMGTVFGWLSSGKVAEYSVGPGEAGPDGPAGRGEDAERGDRPGDEGVAADGDRVAGPPGSASSLTRIATAPSHYLDQ